MCPALLSSPLSSLHLEIQISRWEYSTVSSCSSSSRPLWIMLRGCHRRPRFVSTALTRYGLSWTGFCASSVNCFHSTAEAGCGRLITSPATLYLVNHAPPDHHKLVAGECLLPASQLRSPDEDSTVVRDSPWR